jgi:hypothetical protein
MDYAAELKNFLVPLRLVNPNLAYGIWEKITASGLAISQDCYV